MYEEFLSVQTVNLLSFYSQFVLVFSLSGLTLIILVATELV